MCNSTRNEVAPYMGKMFLIPRKNSIVCSTGKFEEL